MTRRAARWAVWGVAGLLGAVAALTGFLWWVGPCEACGGRGAVVDGPDVVSLCPVCEGAGW